MIKSFEEDTHPEEQALVLPFYGSISSIPEGWALADGSLGTVNALDSFTKGPANYTSTPGASGGENTKTLYTNQIPSHNHAGSVNGVGGHTHAYVSDSRNLRGGNTEEHTGGDRTANSFGGGSHSHPSSNTGNTGTASGIDNRPRFVEMAFIQKL